MTGRQVARDVSNLLQRCRGCVSHKRDVLLGGEGDVQRIAVVGQREVVPSCEAMVCALDVVSPDEADVDYRCIHTYIHIYIYMVMRSLYLSGKRACAIMGRGVIGCMSIAMYGHDVPPDQTDVKQMAAEMYQNIV